MSLHHSYCNPNLTKPNFTANSRALFSKLLRPKAELLPIAKFASTKNLSQVKKDLVGLGCHHLQGMLTLLAW